MIFGDSVPLSVQASSPESSPSYILGSVSSCTTELNVRTPLSMPPQHQGSNSGITQVCCCYFYVHELLYCLVFAMHYADRIPIYQ